MNMKLAMGATLSIAMAAIAGTASAQEVPAVNRYWTTYPPTDCTFASVHDQNEFSRWLNFYGIFDDLVNHGEVAGKHDRAIFCGAATTQHGNADRAGKLYIELEVAEAGDSVWCHAQSVNYDGTPLTPELVVKSTPTTVDWQPVTVVINLGGFQNSTLWSSVPFWCETNSNHHKYQGDNAEFVDGHGHHHTWNDRIINYSYGEERLK